MDIYSMFNLSCRWNLGTPLFYRGLDSYVGNFVEAWYIYVIAER